MMKMTNLLLSIGLLVLTGCISRNLTDNIVHEPTTNPNQMKKIWVHSFFCYDQTNGELKPAYSIFEGDTIIDNSWQCTPITIEGFEYEPGYQYQLEVAPIIRQGLPAYQLSKIISKKRDPAYFRIHDSWALTHLNMQVLPLEERRPTAQINLLDFTISGNGRCNNYSGKLNDYSAQTIVFGPFMTTKMMCPEIEKEQAFMEALANVRYYEIKDLTLFLFDAAHQEILRFQKVD